MCVLGIVGIFLALRFLPVVTRTDFFKVGRVGDLRGFDFHWRDEVVRFFYSLITPCGCRVGGFF